MGRLMPPVSAQTENTPCIVRGTIQQVDLLARELRVLVDGITTDFAVPPACSVVLNGERVKLRLLQPQDAVEVVYRLTGVRALAQSVRVLWAHAPCESVHFPAVPSA
jgi:hypothetical protein